MYSLFWKWPVSVGILSDRNSAHQWNSNFNFIILHIQDILVCEFSP